MLRPASDASAGSDEYGYGVTTTPSSLSDVVQIATRGHHNCAVKRDGTVTCWGAPLHCLLRRPYPGGLEPVSLQFVGPKWAMWVSLLEFFFAGIDYHDETTVPSGLSDVVQIAAGWQYTCAVKRDGTVTCWGALLPCPLLHYAVCRFAACQAWVS